MRVEQTYRQQLCQLNLISPTAISPRRIDALNVKQHYADTLLGIKWYQFVRNDDGRKLTKQPKCNITQSRRLTQLGHAHGRQRRCQDPLSPPSSGLGRQPGPRPTGSEITPPDAADIAQNRPLWRMMSTYHGATQSCCMPETTTTTAMGDVTSSVVAERPRAATRCLIINCGLHHYQQK